MTQPLQEETKTRGKHLGHWSEVEWDHQILWGVIVHVALQFHFLVANFRMKLNVQVYLPVREKCPHILNQMIMDPSRLLLLSRVSLG